MKKIALFLMTCLYCLATFSQETAMKDVFNKYMNNEDLSFVVITEDMFELMRQKNDQDPEDDKEFQSTMQDVKKIVILSYTWDSVSTDKSISYFNDFYQQIPQETYEVLIVVNQKGRKIRFLTRKQNEQIKELLMLVRNGQKTTLMSIVGDIQLDAISRLSKLLKIREMQSLRNLNKN